MGYKNKNEKLAVIEKHMMQLKMLLYLYQSLLKDLVAIQRNSPAYYKNGDMREEVGKKYEEAATIYAKMAPELERLDPILFINVRT